MRVYVNTLSITDNAVGTGKSRGSFNGGCPGIIASHYFREAGAIGPTFEAGVVTDSHL